MDPLQELVASIKDSEKSSMGLVLCGRDPSAQMEDCVNPKRRVSTALAGSSSNSNGPLSRPQALSSEMVSEKKVCHNMVVFESPGGVYGRFHFVSPPCPLMGCLSFNIGGFAHAIASGGIFFIFAMFSHGQVPVLGLVFSGFMLAHHACEIRLAKTTV